MNSRERVQLTMNHHEADRAPLDLGSCAVTGMHVSSVYQLRQALKLDEPGRPIKVIDSSQMLGEIEDDLLDRIGADMVGLRNNRAKFGFRNEGWKPWTLFDGTPVLVPGEFNTEPDDHGDILQHPEGDRSLPPSGHMPHGGHYFDNIIRQQPIEEDNLKAEDNLEEFKIISDEDLRAYALEADRLYETGRAIVGSFGGTAFGDISQVPAPGLKNPKGIRDITEWYLSTVTRPGLIYEIFERQCEIGLENWKRIHAAVGDKLSVIFVTGTDFGAQHGPFISVKTYRDLFKPFHKRLNEWAHRNTSWKTFIHSCGSVRAFIPDFIEAGFDILNPVQCSAACMDPSELKREYGREICFWGGGVDTQSTLPFGTPDEIRAEVRERLKIFMPGGGFVINPTHNVQSCVPTENLLAMYDAFDEFRRY